MSLGSAGSTGNACVYAEQLFKLGYGTPLYEPDSRGYDFDRVRVGDVGWLKDGAFHRLFNLILDHDNPNNDEDFRQAFPQEPRHLNEWQTKIMRPTRLSAGLMKSSSVRKLGGNLGLSGPSQ